MSDAKRTSGALLLALCLAAAGCGDDGGGSDGGETDAGATDGGGTDAGGDDAGGDAGATDGGGDDAGGEDAGPPACDPPSIPALDTEPLAAGAPFENPVYVTQAPGDADTFYVVEQAGRIRLVRGGSVLAEPFLDIRSDVDTSFTERGLLGLAFHPGYESNGRFFVYYTPAGEMANVVAEYERSAGDPDVASPTEVRRLIDEPDPDLNHDGGMIAFGPDGFLYVGMGDGGGACDRHGENGNALDLTSPFGKIHRLDVDAAGAGFVADGNPFVGESGLDTIWAYGLRNPWRFSFDGDTGDLYIGDVGQNEFEEVDFQPASSSGGENYGWRDFEGFEPSTVSGCSPTGLVTDHAEPVVAYAQASEDAVIRGGCSVTGGYVYRGTAIPELEGVYLYGDFCSNDVGAFRYCGEVVGHQRLEDLTGAGGGLASFGEGHDGELYLVYRGSNEVLRIVPGG